MSGSGGIRDVDISKRYGWGRWLFIRKNGKKVVCFAIFKKKNKHLNIFFWNYIGHRR